MGIFGKPNIANLKSKGDVKALQKVLLSEASRVSRESSGVSIGLVVDSAGALLDLDATDVLREAFRDGLSGYCIEEVLKAFVSRSPEKARSFLIDLWFNHKNHQVRESVESHLSTMPHTQLDARTVASLVAVLRDSPRDNIYGRAMAARCLTGVRDADAVAALVGSFNTPWEKVRSAAAAALRGMDAGEKAAVAPALLHSLQDEHAYERRNAINALSALGGADAVEPIAQMLTDPDPSVRSEAAHALAAYGDGRGRDILVAETESMDLDGRARAVGALDRLWGAGDIPTLVRLLRDPADEVRRPAAHGLAELGWVPTMDEDGAYYFLASGEVDGCLRIGAAATKPLMESLAEAWVWRTNYLSLLRVAGEVADPRIVPMLRDMVKKEQEAGGSTRREEGINDAISAITRILERSASVARPEWIELMDLATLPLGRALVVDQGKLDVVVACPSCRGTTAARAAYRASDASFLVCPRCGDDWLVRFLTGGHQGTDAAHVSG